MAIPIGVITACLEAPGRRFINISNGAGSEFEVIGQQGVLDARMGVFIANTAAPDGAIFALAPVSLPAIARRLWRPDNCAVAMATN